MEKQRPTKRRGYQKKSDQKLKIAKLHIKELLAQAKEVSKENQKLADRYVFLARKIAMKFRIKLNSAQKRLFCQHCYHFLTPGKNLRVRVHEHRVIYYCLDCKKFWRRPLKT